MRYLFLLFLRHIHQLEKNIWNRKLKMYHWGIWTHGFLYGTSTVQINGEQHPKPKYYCVSSLCSLIPISGDVMQHYKRRRKALVDPHGASSRSLGHLDIESKRSILCITSTRIIMRLWTGLWMHSWCRRLATALCRWHHI